MLPSQFAGICCSVLMLSISSSLLSFSYLHISSNAGQNFSAGKKKIPWVQTNYRELATEGMAGLSVQLQCPIEFQVAEDTFMLEIIHVNIIWCIVISWLHQEIAQLSRKKNQQLCLNK